MSSIEPRDADRVREEMADLKAYLNGLPGDLAMSSTFAGYRDRLMQLNEELHYALLVQEVPTGSLMEVRLRSREKPEETALPASTVGLFLRLWQSVMDALGQVASGKPTKRGVIPKDVLSETQLLVHAYATGSFAIRMTLPPPSQQDLFERRSFGVSAFALFQELVSAGDDFDALAEVAQRVRIRATSAYGRLLELLRTEDIDFISAARVGSDKKLAFVELDAPKAGRVQGVLGRVKSVQQDVMSIDGVLTGANLRTGGFEIDAGDDGVIVGKVDQEKPKLLKGCPLGREYTFELEETIESQSVMDEMTTAYTLKSISHRES